MKELLKKLALLEKRAAEKLALIKDDTAADAARAIEAEHATIVAEIAETRRAIDAKGDAASGEITVEHADERSEEALLAALARAAVRP